MKTRKIVLNGLPMTALIMCAIATGNARSAAGIARLFHVRRWLTPRPR